LDHGLRNVTKPHFLWKWWQFAFKTLSKVLVQLKELSKPFFEVITTRICLYNECVAYKG
jgi:hypothetical protein